MWMDRLARLLWWGIVGADLVQRPFSDSDPPWSFGFGFLAGKFLRRSCHLQRLSIHRVRRTLRSGRLGGQRHDFYRYFRPAWCDLFLCSHVNNKCERGEYDFDRGQGHGANTIESNVPNSIAAIGK
jgi:hypothetical protein